MHTHTQAHTHTHTHVHAHMHTQAQIYCIINYRECGGHSYGELLLLTAIHFHDNKRTQIEELISDTIGLEIKASIIISTKAIHCLINRMYHELVILEKSEIYSYRYFLKR